MLVHTRIASSQVSVPRVRPITSSIVSKTRPRQNATGARCVEEHTLAIGGIRIVDGAHARALGLVRSSAMQG